MHDRQRSLQASDSERIPSGLSAYSHHTEESNGARSKVECYCSPTAEVVVAGDKLRLGLSQERAEAPELCLTSDNVEWQVICARAGQSTERTSISFEHRQQQQLAPTENERLGTPETAPLATSRRNWTTTAKEGGGCARTVSIVKAVRPFMEMPIFCLARKNTRPRPAWIDCAVENAKCLLGPKETQGPDPLGLTGLWKIKYTQKYNTRNYSAWVPKECYARRYRCSGKHFRESGRI